MPTIGPPATARLLGQTVNVNFNASTGWGTRPATLTLTAPSFAFANVNDVTDLTISQAGETLVWRDVRVAHVEASEPQNAGLWRVTLEDRRWKWQFGHIDGDYNATGPTGSLLRQRTPRQLASLLAAAMGEPSLNVSALPNQARPRKAWRAHVPRDELDRLCADYGCVVAFDGPGDAASIVKVGSGEPFIDTAAYGGRVTRSDRQAIPAWPSQIRIITGPSLFQTWLWCLEAVGEDTDGTIKPIDELSYKPETGWNSPAGMHLRFILGTYQRDGQTLYVRDLAEKCIRKWYRISGQYPFPKIATEWSPAALRGNPVEPTSLDDIGPFLGTRVERDSATGNRLPIVVRGNFYDTDGEKLGGIDTGNQTNAVWRKAARINQETKCLELDERAFLLKSDDGFIFYAAPAELRVLCGYEVSHEGVPVRYEKWLDNSGPHHGAKARVEHHEEIVREVVEQMVGAAGGPDNLADVNSEADFYLNSINAEYEVRPTAQIEVPLIRRFAPDGVLRQIQWQGSAESAPTTTLSYNAEISSLHPDFRDTAQARARREAEQAARQRAAIQQGKIKIGLN